MTQAQTRGHTRIALAGFGAWGQMHAKAISAIEGAEITSVYCHSERSAEAAAAQLPEAQRFDDFDAMLAAGGFDAVNVTVPNNVHASFAVRALEAGADVFLEKPVGITLAECDAVIEAARKADRRVAINHELRVSHQWRGVREIIAAGDIGAVRYQHFSLFRHKFRQGSGGWRYDPARVGSWVLEELVHFFDLVMWYAAEHGAPHRVTAHGSGGNDDLVENFATVLEWENGATAVLSQCLSGFEHHTLLEIGGTNGGVRTWWSGAADRTLHPEFELKVQRGSAPVETVSIPQSGEVFELEENLRLAYAGFREKRSILTPQEARIAVAVCLAAEQSYREGKPVTLDQS
ncbi:Gfo/Idh/MocA family protein [Pseudohoeflea coraliihabitans]|uniref:Gfo/Idh/MocA family oxidoreductase n=1 Tax=Pseudohoeflea coraliihabitans TaxID=2860393 RepID=A0ABS6WKZ2_9HYPH|nr:Gfo/Idh/MocA family oxidoreductase [Pseudohoeflea sp. DP4N28-3]MBW3096623.1 Gfo/Idh/MocA family oxidoreductase [Pseudohoeflea sp. DP4N28-3]